MTTSQNAGKKTVIALEFSYTARTRTRNRKVVALVATIAKITPIRCSVLQSGMLEAASNHQLKLVRRWTEDSLCTVAVTRHTANIPALRLE